MTLLEEVRGMQQQAMSDEQIVQAMRERGASYRDIADALAQTKIKAAVEQPDADPQAYGEAPAPTSPEGMQASLMGPSQDFQDSQQPQELAPPSPNQPYAPAPSQDYPAYAPDSYGQTYQQYPQQNTSPDLITEIAEQVMAEKLGEIRKQLEKIADMRTSVESRIEFLDDRLKKIEKTIDVLQSSVLRKVGDYVTNIQDIKTELIETQKTFAKLAGRKQNTPHHNPNTHHTHPHHAHQHKK